VMTAVAKHALQERGKAVPPPLPSAAPGLKSKTMMLGEPAPAPQPARAAAPVRARDSTRAGGYAGMPSSEELALEGGGEAGRREETAPEPAGLTASEDMLAYGKLRMGSARSRTRGRLVIAERRELYLALLSEKHVEVSFDAVSVVDAATRSAEAVFHRAPPAGCTPVWSGSYDYAYTADSEADIPSDGDFHSIPLVARPSTSEMRYVVVPREATEVFRFAELKNSLAAPLLVGPCDVYLDDQFLLTTDLRFTPPDDTVRLGLGVEQAVKVSRNTRFDEDSAGLLGGSRDLSHEVHIEARNLMDRPADLEVRVRVPTLREGEQDITVELSRVSPAWEPYDPFGHEAAAPELRGGYTWRTDIPAGEVARFDVHYQIRISSKHELVGGNRREN